MKLNVQKVHRIFSLWTNRENEWLTYKDIVKDIKSFGISERTLARYLSRLVQEGKLVKEERGYKRTFYKPYDRFMDQLRKSRDLFRVYEANLSKLGPELVDGLEKAILESRDTDERIENLICDEIEKMPAEEGEEEFVASKAISNVLSREKLSTSDRESLHEMIEPFLAENFYRDLSNVPCAGTIEPHLLIEFFSNNIQRMVLSYAELWYFLYKNPGASFEFESYMSEKIQALRTWLETKQQELKN